MHSFGTPLLIAEPTAGTAPGDLLRRLRAALDGRGLLHDVRFAGGRTGQAGAIARDEAQNGRRYLIAVGDDRIVHEIVNGLVDAATGTLRGQDPVLGIVSGDRGDLVRTFGLDRSPEVLANHLVTEATVAIDLGRIQLTGRAGSASAVVFANIAQAGFGASVAATTARLPRQLGPVRRPLGTVGAAARFRRVITTIDVEGGSRTEPVCNVVVANGQFFERGLLVAPRALPSDGRFNVQSWGGTVADVLRSRRSLAHGRHLEREDVREWQSAEVAVSTRFGRPLTVEADGTVVGTTPASFDVLPGILRLKT